MKGALDFLLGNSREASVLRKKFVFKVVPMLNPDGVVYGNYRCSLLGVDLNRRWLQPNKLLHPEIYYCKRLVQMIAEEREVLMYCDMHGHSVKKDVFMYGCCNREKPKENLFIRIFPYMLSRRNKMFAYKQCSFKMHSSKDATGRMVCFQEIGIIASYTMEASFYGPSHKAALENRSAEANEANGDAHMTQDHLEGMGRDFCKQLLMFLNGNEFTKRVREVSHILIQGPSGLTRSEVSQTVIKETESYSSESEEGEEYDVNQLISAIDTEDLEELYTSEGNEGDGSDSSGSENDEKKMEYKRSKILRSVKTRIRTDKSANFLERKKTNETSSMNIRPLSESPTVSFTTNFTEKMQRYYPITHVGRDSLAQSRFTSKSPELDVKSTPLAKALQAGGGYKSGLKYAAAVKLPKESTIFRGAIHGKVNNMNERRAKRERDREREKCELARTRVKFKEVHMYISDEGKHRTTTQEFYNK